MHIQDIIESFTQDFTARVCWDVRIVAGEGNGRRTSRERKAVKFVEAEEDFCVGASPLRYKGQGRATSCLCTAKGSFGSGCNAGREKSYDICGRRWGWVVGDRDGRDLGRSFSMWIFLFFFRCEISSKGIIGNSTERDIRARQSSRNIYLPSA